MIPKNSKHWRSRIAQHAAQLIAEHGIQDYTQAKRKAARQLDAPQHVSFPDNDEVDAALKDYLALFAPEVQTRELQRLRRQALAIMQQLAGFKPVLTGGLVSGAISRHSNIELDLYGDASKGFEIFLLNADIPFRTEERPGCSIFHLSGTPADIRIRFLPTQMQHPAPRGEMRHTLNAVQLAAMIDAAEASESAIIRRQDPLEHPPT